MLSRPRIDVGSQRYIALSARGAQRSRMSRRTPLRTPRTYDTSREIPSALRATAVPQESHESHWNNEMREGGVGEHRGVTT